jgi:hypothetical protein
VDGAARERMAKKWLDQSNHLAKVRVAGSNPVFRSILQVRGGFPVHRILAGSACSANDDRAEDAPVGLAGVEQGSDAVVLEVAEPEADEPH